MEHSLTGTHNAVNAQPFLGIRSQLLRRSIFGFYIVAELAYLFWRAGFTLSGATPVYSWLLLGAEVYVILNAIWFYVLLGPKNDRGDPPRLSRELSVDVFITTYNEDVDLVRTTAIAARDIDYPHHTWILDDGRRPAMKAMAEEVGVGYITRPTNEHYKAGNLNHAMTVTTADLVMNLDADHIPRRTILSRMVGYFEDSKVALVQTPQIYYNISSYQHRTSKAKGLLWHEGRIFQHRIMAGAERAGCAFFIGTGGLLRRSALNEIGGFATGSVTEDIFTSMRLHAAGYRSVFVDEPLGFLQAPKSPAAYALQRLRWAQGGLQILRKENPLFKRGLSWFQRIAYFNSLSHSLACFPNLLFYLVPALYLLFYLSPINANPLMVLPFVAGHLIINLLVYKLLAAPDGRLMEGGFFKFINLPIHLRATLRLIFPKGLVFKVTPKGRQERVPLTLWVPATVLILLHTFAVAVGIRRVFDGEISVWVAGLSVFFSGSFMVLGLYVLRRTFSVKVEDEVMYVPLDTDILVRYRGMTDWRLARLKCLGPSLAVVDCPLAAWPGDILQLDMASTGMRRPVNARVMTTQPASVRNRANIEFKLTDLEPREEETINRFLFNTALPNFLGSFVDSQFEGPPPDTVDVQTELLKYPLAAFTPHSLPAVGRNRSGGERMSQPSGSYYRVVSPDSATPYPAVLGSANGTAGAMLNTPGRYDGSTIAASAPAAGSMVSANPGVVRRSVENPAAGKTTGHIGTMPSPSLNSTEDRLPAQPLMWVNPRLSHPTRGRGARPIGRLTRDTPSAMKRAFAPGWPAIRVSIEAPLPPIHDQGAAPIGDPYGIESPEIVDLLDKYVIDPKDKPN